MRRRFLLFSLVLLVCLAFFVAPALAVTNVAAWNNGFENEFYLWTVSADAELEMITHTGLFSAADTAADGVNGAEYAKTWDEGVVNMTGFVDVHYWIDTVVAGGNASLLIEILLWNGTQFDYDYGTTIDTGGVWEDHSLFDDFSFSPFDESSLRSVNFVMDNHGFGAIYLDDIEVWAWSQEMEEGEGTPDDNQTPLTVDEVIAGGVSFTIPVLTIFIPAYLLGIMFHLGKWGFVTGTIIGTVVGTAFLPTYFPVWFAFLIVVAAGGLVINAARGG